MLVMMLPPYGSMMFTPYYAAMPHTLITPLYADYAMCEKVVAPYAIHCCCALIARRGEAKRRACIMFGILPVIDAAMLVLMFTFFIIMLMAPNWQMS